MKNISRKYGFTLLELMVVVIIIAVLAAVALPQYKKAVMKSRFSTVMPMAKALADAQEVYFLGKGYYAQEDQKDMLDVAPVTAENISVTLSETDGYDYVLAQRTDIPEVHYVVYQKNSVHYPGEIHCEAQDNNDLAAYLCQSIGGAQPPLGKTITNGYTTYIVKGTGSGLPIGVDTDNGNNTSNETNANQPVVVSCNTADAMGFLCNVTENAEGKQVKKICTTLASGEKFCRTKTYDTDGGYTSVTCKADSEGVCTDNLVSVTFDKYGNKTSAKRCTTIESGICSEYSPSMEATYKYDANGNLEFSRVCSSFEQDGSCSGTYSGSMYTYDGSGRMTSYVLCGDMESNGTCNWNTWGRYYQYDAYGHQMQWECMMYDNGSCSQWMTGGANGSVNVYNASGAITGVRQCNVPLVDGKCNEYSTWGNSDFTLDGNGNVVRSKDCASVNSNGGCDTYSSGMVYTYDGNNRVTERGCDGWNGDKCASYTWGYDNVYTDGKLTQQKQCYNFDNEGVCTEYSNITFYEYDPTNGKQTVQKNCTSLNGKDCTQYHWVMGNEYDINGNPIRTWSCALDSNGNNCQGDGGNVNLTVYDDNGKAMVNQDCYGVIDITTGECSGSYDDFIYTYEN